MLERSIEKNLLNYHYHYGRDTKVFQSILAMLGVMCKKTSFMTETYECDRPFNRSQIKRHNGVYRLSFKFENAALFVP